MGDDRPVVGIDGQAGDVGIGDVGQNVTKTTITGANPDKLVELLLAHIKELMAYHFEDDQRREIRQGVLNRWLFGIALAVATILFILFVLVVFAALIYGRLSVLGAVLTLGALTTLARMR